MTPEKLNLYTEQLLLHWKRTNEVEFTLAKKFKASVLQFYIKGYEFKPYLDFGLEKELRKYKNKALGDEIAYLLFRLQGLKKEKIMLMRRGDFRGGGDLYRKYIARINDIEKIIERNPVLTKILTPEVHFRTMKEKPNVIFYSNIHDPIASIFYSIDHEEIDYYTKLTGFLRHDSEEVLFLYIYNKL